MSRLSQLLNSSVPAATPATSATQRPESSKRSKSSRPYPQKTHLPADLQRRIRAMGERWRYTADDLEMVLGWASEDPAAWCLAVQHDEAIHGVGPRL